MSGYKTCKSGWQAQKQPFYNCRLRKGEAKYNMTMCSSVLHSGMEYGSHCLNVVTCGDMSSTSLQQNQQRLQRKWHIPAHLVQPLAQHQERGLGCVTWACRISTFSLVSFCFR